MFDQITQINYNCGQNKILTSGKIVLVCTLDCHPPDLQHKFQHRETLGSTTANKKCKHLFIKTIASSTKPRNRNSFANQK